jgi:hypothetical protein
MSASESTSGSPVAVTTLAERKSCGCCNYNHTRFYRLGEPPEPDSPNPDKRGLCAGCFSQMLAGEGIFESAETEFRVQEVDQEAD